MPKLPYSKYLKSSQSAFTLLELIVVLVIVGIMLAIAIYGVIKFRQVIVVSNATKELVLQLRKARRYSINNVVTSNGDPTQGYYVYIDSNDYSWGECSAAGCSHAHSVKSAQYSGIDVTLCDNIYKVLKFNHVTGEFVITETDVTEVDPGVSPASCTITVSIPGAVVRTQRTVVVSSEERTVRIE